MYPEVKLFAPNLFHNVCISYFLASVFQSLYFCKLIIHLTTKCDLFTGKLNRGLSVVDSYKLLKGEELTEDELFLSRPLGWCIEWVITYKYQKLFEPMHEFSFPKN